MPYHLLVIPPGDKGSTSSKGGREHKRKGYYPYVGYLL